MMKKRIDIEIIQLATGLSKIEIEKNIALRFSLN
jgi:hypothetical protein